MRNKAGVVALCLGCAFVLGTLNLAQAAAQKQSRTPLVAPGEDSGASFEMPESITLPPLPSAEPAKRNRATMPQNTVSANEENSSAEGAYNPPLKVLDTQSNRTGELLESLNGLPDYEVAKRLQKQKLLLESLAEIQKLEISFNRDQQKFTEDLRKSIISDMSGSGMGGIVLGPGGSVPLAQLPNGRMQMPAAAPAPAPERRVIRPDDEGQPTMRVTSIQCDINNKCTSQIINDGGLMVVSVGEEIDAKNKVSSISSQGVKVERTLEDAEGRLSKKTVLLPFAR